MNSEKKNQVIDQFLQELEKIRGLFSDLELGIYYYHQNLVEFRKQSIIMFARTNPQFANDEYLDKQLSVHAEEIHPPVLDGKTTRHNLTTFNVTTQGELLKRTSDGGEDYYELSNWIIVLIYQLWETKYRQSFAESLGYLNKDELKVPIFGELGYLRHSILKKQGYAIDKLETNSEVLTYFKHNQKINLSVQILATIFEEIKKALNESKPFS